MDVEESPWADSSQPSQPTSQSEAPTSQATTTSTASQPAGSTTTSSSRVSRGPRRLVAQSTKLEAVEDPLGPLGAAPADDGLPGSQGDAPPVPPQKEQMVIRTTMSSQQQGQPPPVHDLDLSILQQRSFCILESASPRTIPSTHLLANHDFPRGTMRSSLDPVRALQTTVLPTRGYETCCAKSGPSFDARSPGLRLFGSLSR
jgi:hypothetical protein